MAAQGKEDLTDRVAESRLRAPGVIDRISRAKKVSQARAKCDRPKAPRFARAGELGRWSKPDSREKAIPEIQGFKGLPAAHPLNAILVEKPTEAGDAFHCRFVTDLIQDPHRDPPFRKGGKNSEVRQGVVVVRRVIGVIGAQKFARDRVALPKLYPIQSADGRRGGPPTAAAAVSGEGTQNSAPTGIPK